ncbi:Cytoskeletal signaling protein slm1 [Hypsizygus marmoreus]|uniref:Cytoskeletal signaling protein slm1 n=1 Tax=Hypsizygus marmoreus TaxID=39966 RepID=A0A369K6G7_HYPMA|nr:Cytoskeletal signaling protein slm1 [Hypsizygus marmoreus]
MNHDGQSISRATSISRASKQGSTISRNQSLIKKNVAPQDLRPSDVLIERFIAWKAIIKQLIAYFEGIADIENNTAKELTRLGAVIQVPFRSGNQFLGEGGLQDVYYGIRDKTRVIADQHANLGRTIDGSIVQHLQKLRTEIKAHIKNVQNDTGKLATSVAKERELSAKFISELASSISSYKNTPMSVTNKTDPYVCNTAVTRQLQKQVHEENLLQKSIIIMQQNSAHFEEGIVRSLQSAWQTFDEWQSRSSLAIQDSFRGLSTHMASLAPDREWISFSARSDHLLDPDTPLRNPENIVYPSKDDPSVIAVHTGHLERKKRFTRHYRESYFVLTAAGFLHEYASSDPATHEGQNPMFSLFLPACTLGPPSAANAKSHKFHIEGRKDGTGTTKTGSFKLLTGGQHAWSFRARSREDMMEWWNDIRMLCSRYLVASEQMERSGPVAAAVRAAGYVSEEEDEEDEGSSVEEEEGEEEGEEEEEYQEAQEGQPPSYAHPEKNDGVAVGGNGYPIDKKAGPVQPNGVPGPDETNVDVSRRPSQRQQDKAPEGRAPRVDANAEGADTSGHDAEESIDHHEDQGTSAPPPVHSEAASPRPGPAPAPVESKFTEAL